MNTAKIFESGNSQAIRLPKAYRFDTTKTKELVIQRSGDMLILTPKEKLWENFMNTPPVSPDFLAERDQGVVEERDWPCLNSENIENTRNAKNIKNIRNTEIARNTENAEKTATTPEKPKENAL